MKFEKPSQVLAALMWLSVIVESWLLILRAIPSDALSSGALVFFFFIALVASAVASAPPKKAG